MSNIHALPNLIQAIFNYSMDDYQENSPFSGDIHMSVNFSQRASAADLRKLKAYNPIGTGRSWSHVEKDLVTTFNQFLNEFIAQTDNYFKTYNKFIIKSENEIRAVINQQKKENQPEKLKQLISFIAKEEVEFWNDFPRDKKFYHSYLRKLYSLFNQCRMPDQLRQENQDSSQINKQQHFANQQKKYIRDIQLVLSLCLDLMPQASQGYKEKIQYKKNISSMINNVWELTDYQTQTVLSNESGEIRDTSNDQIADGSSQNQSQDIKKSKSNGGSYGETIISGGNIMSLGGGAEGKNQILDAGMDKEQRHLRKYLYQNRINFDCVVEKLKMFDADNRKNWQILGQLMAIMASDVIQVFLSTQENIKISFGLVEAMMIYCGHFSKTHLQNIEYFELLPVGTPNIFENYQNIIQYQWAQIFGQISKLSNVTFDNCLNFINQSLVNDHNFKKPDEINDFADQIFLSRFLSIQPNFADTNLQKQKLLTSNGRKAQKVLNLFSELLNYLKAPKIQNNFKIVLLKTFRHLIAQLNFRDSEFINQNEDLKKIWQSGIQNVFQFVDSIMITKVFPGVSSINLNRRVSQNHWDQLVDNPFNQHVLLLGLQIIKVSEESFYNQAILRFMNWLCLPQMLKYEKTFDLGFRILLELYTPELYKVIEFMQWQPKVLNHIYFLKDYQKDFCIPIVSHVNLQVYTQMPHRSPVLLNHSYRNYENFENQASQQLVNMGISFYETFPIIFDKKLFQLNSQNKSLKRQIKFMHIQYLDLMALYDFEFLQMKVLPEFLLNIDDEQSYSLELVLLALQQSNKILNPSNNFRQKYLTVHQQIGEKLQDDEYLISQMNLFDELCENMKNFTENAMVILAQSHFYNGKIALDNADFYRSHQYNDLCSDKMDIIWPSTSLSCMKESDYVSKFLQKNGLAEHLIEINSSEVTFEDYVEIQAYHFDNPNFLDPNNVTNKINQNQQKQILQLNQQNDINKINEQYEEKKHGRFDDFFEVRNQKFGNQKGYFSQNGREYGDEDGINNNPQYCHEQLNQIIQNVDKEINLTWDKKKERYIRRRLMAYLLEDRNQQIIAPQKQKERSKSKGVEINTLKDSWLNDSNLVNQKQQTAIFGEKSCLKRNLQIQIKNEIIKLMSFMPQIFENTFLNKFLCKNLMLNEKSIQNDKEQIFELTDQVYDSIEPPENDFVFQINFKNIYQENKEDFGKFEIKLRESVIKYKNEQKNKIQSEKIDKNQILGGTFRLNQLKFKPFKRLQGNQNIALVYDLLSTDYQTCTIASKTIQKVVMFGSLEVKVSLIDQILYILKELMIEQIQDFHLPMIFQQLLSCIKLWHHSEIHKLRISQQSGVAKQIFQGVQFISIDSSKKQKKLKKMQDSNNLEEDIQVSLTYPEIQNYLYIFDLIDGLSLVGTCNKDKIVRSISLILIQEAGKLKRLIAGHDSRKSLQQIIYCNESAIKERISERFTLMEMFRHKQSIKNADGVVTKIEQFTRIYDKRDIDQILYNLSFYKIVEDNFDYKQAKINESLVRDITVQYIGEIATLWKNEFKNLIENSRLNLKDSQLTKLKKQHRVMGVKLINFIFNICRRTLLLFEQKVDSLKIQEINDNKNDIQKTGPKISQQTRKKQSHSSLFDCQKDYTGINILGALTLYNITISSYNQIELKDLNQFLEQSNFDDVFENNDDNLDLIQQNLQIDPVLLKLSNIQHDLFNIIQLLNQDSSDYFKLSSGNFYPNKIPISSVITSFLFLVQSPLPLSLNQKRIQIHINQAKQDYENKVQIADDIQTPTNKLQYQDSQMNKIEVQNVLESQFNCLKDIFNNSMEDNLSGQYLKNSILYYSLMFLCSDSIDGDYLTTEIAFLIKRCQKIQQNYEIIQILLILADMVSQMLTNESQLQAVDIIKAILFNGVAKVIKVVLQQLKSHEKVDLIEFHEYFQAEKLSEIAKFCQNNRININQDWIIHKNRQTLLLMLQLQSFIFKIKSKKDKNGIGNSTENLIQLDLEYLINMQNLGYNVLQYFRFEQNSYDKKVELSVDNQIVQGVNEIKLLINSVYQFYKAQEDVSELLLIPNPFYECFLNQFIPRENENEQAKFLNLLQENRFKQVYERIIKVCFNIKYPNEQSESNKKQQQQKRILIDTQVKKFIQYNIHSKFFLLSLSMALNIKSNGDPLQISQIERSRLICISTLPLMFEDEDFREQCEDKISKMPDLSQLIQFDNKDFFRLIKIMIKDEDIYNLHNHFEKYFSVNGFTRNLLNEIIKLQSQNDNQKQTSGQMIIKILDSLSYFISQKGGQGFQLRRAPHSSSNHSSFLFDHLIDYKSFEFLQKLFKISEKLFEYDQELIIMNMWYKLVENQKENYEILAKFLIHNLSSFMVKLKVQAQSQQNKLQKQNMSKSQIFMLDKAQYGIEFEKQKRYSINILNYIKARTQRADIRNSIQISSESPSWTKKMIELLLFPQLNIQSKYVLEKIKLKKILQNMHREINKSGVALRLKGGIDTEVLELQFQEKQNIDQQENVRQSIKLSQLLESQTFLSAFANNNKKEQSIIENLLFNFQRIIKQKFIKITPSSQLNQFNELLIKYFENSLVFIANDTDRQLQVFKINKDEELTIAITILILLVHLLINQSEQRHKYLLNIFKSLLNNINVLQNHFNFVNFQYTSQSLYCSVSSKSAKLSQPDNSYIQKVVDKILSLFNYKTSLFSCFDQFTLLYFRITSNITMDSELRLITCELYNHIFRGLKEQQRNILSNNQTQSQQISQNGPNVSQSQLSFNQNMEFIQCGKKIRSTVLSVLLSAFNCLHELAFIKVRLDQQGRKQIHASIQSTQSTQNQTENKQIHYLCKSFRQHIQNIMDLILFSNEIDKVKQNLKSQQSKKDKVLPAINDVLASDMSSQNKQILFASNTLFWIGIACLQAPNHMLNEIEENKLAKPNQVNPYLIQIQQIQYVGILVIRRTLEETNLLKILIVFQKLSNTFFSYNLQMSSDNQSFIGILFDSIRNPLCTKDALKMLSISIGIQDSRLLIGQSKLSQSDQSPIKSQEILNDDQENESIEQKNISPDQQLQQALARVELIRLLYLIPYFMEQFLTPIGLGNSDDQIFQNKKSMIRLLKKCLPSIGIDKKSNIIDTLEEIQKQTADYQQEKEDEQKKIGKSDLFEQFKILVQQTIDLIYQMSFKGSLADVLSTFQIIHQYQNQRQKANQIQGNQDIPFQLQQFIIQKITLVLKNDKIDDLLFQFNQWKQSNSIYNFKNQKQFSKYIFGEDPNKYRVELKCLYFELKNIISKEIEYLDKDHDVNQFFDYDASRIQNIDQDKNESSNRKESLKLQKQKISSHIVQSSSTFQIQNNSAKSQKQFMQQSFQNNQQNTEVLEQQKLQQQTKLIRNKSSIKEVENIQEEKKYTHSPTSQNDRLNNNQEDYSQRRISFNDLETNEQNNEIQNNNEQRRSSFRTNNHHQINQQPRSKSSKRYEQTEEFQDLESERKQDDIVNQQIKSKNSFAEMTREQQKILQTFNTVQNQKELLKDINLLNQNKNDDLFTFQKKKANQQNNIEISQLPGPKYEQSNAEIEFYQKQRAYVGTADINRKQTLNANRNNYFQEKINEEIVVESETQRKFHQDLLNPIDNQSQNSYISDQHLNHILKQENLVNQKAQSQYYVKQQYINPQQDRIIQYYDEQEKYQNQIVPQRKKSQYSNQIQAPAALQPNYVANKSNQIWSEVASERSFKLYEKYSQSEDNFDRNSNVQSERSQKSFTQQMNDKKYKKNEPNFDFSQK